MKYIFISFLIIFFGFFGLFNPIRDLYLKFASPIQFGLKRSAITIKESITFYSRISSVHRDNLELKSKILELESTIADLKNLEDENTLLKQQLGLRSDSSSNNIVLAEVMGNPNDLTGVTVYINKGSKHGIKVGDNVVVGNILLGIVKEVFAERSLVELIISPNVSFTVKDLDSPSKTEGLSRGQYGTSIIMERILHSEIIKVGDNIVTSGKDGNFNPEMIVGKVTEVVDDPSQPLKKAYINTSYDFSKIYKVFILIREN